MSETSIIAFFHFYSCERIETQKLKDKDQFDKDILNNTKDYKVGHKIYVKGSQIKDKLQNKYTVPF